MGWRPQSPAGKSAPVVTSGRVSGSDVYVDERSAFHAPTSKKTTTNKVLYTYPVRNAGFSLRDLLLRPFALLVPFALHRRRRSVLVSPRVCVRARKCACSVGRVARRSVNVFQFVAAGEGILELV